jgi:hypothetical protein
MSRWLIGVPNMLAVEEDVVQAFEQKLPQVTRVDIMVPIEL